MCQFYDSDVPRKCREEDAEEVIEKERLNFCDFFTPGYDVFDAREAGAVAVAQKNLATLFGEQDSSEQETEVSSDLQNAEDLFK